MTTRARADELEPFVSSLDRYPSWLGIINTVEPVSDSQGRAAWIVELRARLGPLARSKRLRMVRTENGSEHGAGRRWVFERIEFDGRPHSAWLLDVVITDDSAPPPGTQPRLTRLDMHLRYGGSMWGPVLERLLRDEIERSIPRLRALVER